MGLGTRGSGLVCDLAFSRHVSNVARGVESAHSSPQAPAPDELEDQPPHEIRFTRPASRGKRSRGAEGVVTGIVQGYGKYGISDDRMGSPGTSAVPPAALLTDVTETLCASARLHMRIFGGRPRR